MSALCWVEPVFSGPGTDVAACLAAPLAPVLTVRSDRNPMPHDCRRDAAALLLPGHTLQLDRSLNIRLPAWRPLLGHDFTAAPPGGSARSKADGGEVDRQRSGRTGSARLRSYDARNGTTTLPALLAGG